jgi:hypothetical protein
LTFFNHISCNINLSCIGNRCAGISTSPNPFNVIRLKFNFNGLFVLRLGTECYADCAATMMEGLPPLLPQHDSEVQVAILVVCGESKNGYDLFWGVLELAVPEFDPTVPINQPWWNWDTDVLAFDSHDGFLHMHLSLVCHDGLYYCPTDAFTINHSPIRVNSAWAPTNATILCVSSNCPQSVLRCPLQYKPTTKARQLESEVWLLCLESPGVYQVGVLPQLTTGLPPALDYHPFQFVNFKEQARILKQVAQHLAVRTTKR